METNGLFNAAEKRSLVLSGGGLRVAYQAGTLIALEEAGIKFHHVDGTSGGIFNAAMLASGLSPHHIAERWRQLRLGSFISGKKAKSYLRPFKMQGYADADNIRRKVFPHLGINLDLINKNSAVSATFNVCNFSDKSVEAISGSEVLEDHLIAGVSLPVFMPAIKIGKDWYSDAVWIKDANLLEAVGKGSDELWLIWAIGNSPTYLPGAFHQYVHMIEMSANGGLLEEFNQIRLINGKTISEDSSGQQTPIKLFVIRSQVALPLDPDFFFNKINARELINMGYAHAKTYLHKIPVSGEAMDKTATKCEEPESILSFRGEFKGTAYFNLVESEIRFFVYFRFNEFLERDQLDVYSSIIIDGHGLEIPLYDNQVMLGNDSGKIQLIVNGSFLKDGKPNHIKTSYTLTSPWEIALGLNFKELNFQIQNGNGTTISEGNLFQPISNRLKSLYFTRLTSLPDRQKGIRKKISMIKRLMTYGI